jgi:succinate dehydrogenase/fumarate reductase flavoprotein subunit
LIEPIYRECLKSGRVQFYWNTRITKLTQQGPGVTSVEGVNERTGAAFHMPAKAIVIATGGFQSNLQIVKEHWPSDLSFPPKILIGSGVNALGSGLDLARQVGAAVARLDHQWNYPRGIPDPRYPGGNRGLHVLGPAVVWVNANGERFVNEAGGTVALLKQMLGQPGARVWMVFDAEGRKSLTVAGTDWTDPGRVDSLILHNPELAQTADRLDTLAKKAGWPTAKFLAAVAQYNSDLHNGTDTKFGRFNPQDPPAARVGRPAITPLIVPPFYAIPIYPMTRKSLGGIVVDLEGRVLNERGQPIPNLYAAGEVTGFNGLNGRAGLEGTFLGPSILQGRILGQKLASLATTRTESEVSAPVNAPKTDAAASAPCQSCHPVKDLIATPRKGYWHFERVHKLVLDRAWECQSCHSEMSPFDAKQHRTNGLAQIAACSRCHLSGK